MNETVLVFRKQLLAYSETFIASQAKFLPTMQAILVGYKRNDSGFHLIDDQKYCIQSEHTQFKAFARMRSSLGFGLNQACLKLLKKENPSLIHAHFGPNAYAALPIAKQLNIPLIVTFHGYDITKKDRHRSSIKKREKVFQQAAKIIAISDFIKRQLIDKGCPEDKIVKHYIGVDIDYFTGEKQEACDPTIVFVGRLIQQKGCSYLLDAMHRVQAEIPHARLQFVGDGPMKEELKSRATSLNNIEFLGIKNRQQVRGLLLKSWVMCAPSISADNGSVEGLGMVFLEAQSLETPVVSFAAGGVVEAIAHGETGFTVPEKKSEALADSLLRLLQNEALRRQYGQAGRARVCEKFNLHKQCATLEEIYKSVL